MSGRYYIYIFAAVSACSQGGVVFSLFNGHLATNLAKSNSTMLVLGRMCCFHIVMFLSELGYNRSLQPFINLIPEGLLQSIRTILDYQYCDSRCIYYFLRSLPNQIMSIRYPIVVVG